MAGIQLESRAVKQQEQEVHNKYDPKNDRVFLELLEFASRFKIEDDFSSGLKNNWIVYFQGGIVGAETKPHADMQVNTTDLWE